MENLKKQDPKIYNLIKKEVERQKVGINLIASENYTSNAVLEAMATALSNKYSEGYPGKRYYAGNKFIDMIENEAIDRLKKLFNAEYANVQPHSGSQANQAAYLAVLKPGDKILGMDLTHGGHLTHGSPVNFSGKVYKFSHYGVDQETGMIDYDEVEKMALKFKPKLIVCGATAYPRKIDFKRFRKIADEVGAYLMGDVAHISGLIVGGVHESPFPHCDIVTSTTHKTLRGPRSGVIMCKIKDRLDTDGKVTLAQKIDRAVFPGVQGGPLDHVVAAKAVAFKDASTAGFKKYQAQIVKNAKAMAEVFDEAGIKMVSGGTDTHLILLDLSDIQMGTVELRDQMEKAEIFTNQNTIPFEKRSPFNPSGMRIGTPAITSRGFKEKDAKKVAELMVEVMLNPKSKKVLDEVKKEVRILTKKYPVDYKA